MYGIYDLAKVSNDFTRPSVNTATRSLQGDMSTESSNSVDCANDDALDKRNRMSATHFFTMRLQCTPLVDVSV